jgi:DNA-binding cell septation regulator SpoVG
VNINEFVVDIELTDRAGSVKAFARVTVELAEGSLILYSFKVTQVDGKPPFVGFPSVKGKTDGKYFPIVDAKGEIRAHLTKLVLEAYQKAKAA